MKENEFIEFKREITTDILKEIVAFANSNGGKIYIGVDDDGAILGLENINSDELKLISKIKDNIKPDLSLFFDVHKKTIENKEILILDIKKGTRPPYYLASKGLKPSGVYIRIGTVSAPVDEDSIRKMIMDTDGQRFETARSIEQNLEFYYAEQRFKKQSLDFGDSQKITLGIMDKENIYSNLGLLLSEQCRHSIKVGVFGNDEKSDFIDRKEFGGSLLQQLDMAYEYIGLHNKNSAKLVNLERMDSEEYPEAALREALLNAIVHRDYSFSGSIIVNIFSDRIEITSLGSIPNGLTENDIMLGVSQPRNEKLASIFYRLGLIESYGIGIGRIIKSYEDFFKKPIFEGTENAFKITLPNKSFKVLESNLSKEDLILKAIEKNSFISRKDVEDILKVKSTTAVNVLKEMQNNNLIQRIGKGKDTRYTKK